MLVATNGVSCFVSAPSRMVSLQCRSHRLREQLDSLYNEAETTRTRANNTRLRLMRLSEAAEKLRNRATSEVQAGNETIARDLLLQKRKVMEALEKSKRRIQVLDQLLTKLSEAISVKETQLIGAAAAYLCTEEDIVSPIRIVSPKEVLRESRESQVFDSTSTDSEVSKEYACQSDQQPVVNVPSKHSVVENFENMSAWEEKANNFEVMSFETFVEHMDRKLDDLESEVITFLRLTTTRMEDEEKHKNPKVKIVMEILTAISDTRERLVNASKIKKGSR